MADIDEKTTLEEIKALVEGCGRKGEDINELLFLCAERHPNPATLKILLKAGADVNAKDNEGRTPLMEAMRRNNAPAILKFLIEAGADIDAKDNNGRTPLMAAASARWKWHQEALRFFIDAGADVNAKDNNGATPLMAAAAEKTLEILKLLIDAGADVNAKDNNGRTPLMAAARRSLEVLRSFVEAGADINAKDNEGQTPLMAFAKKNTSEALKFLIDAGADVNAKDDNGRTPLIEAAEKNIFLLDVLRFLIEAGADVNAKDNNGQTPSLWAARRNDEALKLLVEAGANVNAKDNEDRAPLRVGASTHELSKEDIEQLADLVKRIENFKGDWTGGGPFMNALASEAMHFLYEKNLIIHFAWSEWDEGREFFKVEDIQKCQKIDKESVLKLLTAVARSDRFCSGAWADLFETGVGLGLFKRLLEIETSDNERAAEELTSSCWPRKLYRAQGCLMGQLVGDSLGSFVEFKSPKEIRKLYPGGVRDLADGGPSKLLAGQPTDDSEMALALARTLIERRDYDSKAVRDAYVFWLDSGPFECGNTIAGALRGKMNPESQANGAMMRVSPLGIWCVRHVDDSLWDMDQAYKEYEEEDEEEDEEENGFQTIARLAAEDAKITHPHKVCVDANILYVVAIAGAIENPQTPQMLYDKIVGWANRIDADPALRKTVEAARSSPPDCTRQMGWVLVALQNALYQLLHAHSFEEALVDTVMRGGDTDTNAAICGALLGAVYGLEAIPERWREAVLNCKPSADNPKVKYPRPEYFWPTDALTLAGQLLRNPDA